MHNRSSNVSHEQRQSLAKMADSLRQIIEDSITLDASSEQLYQFNQQLAATAQQIKSLTSDKRALEYYNPNFGEVINDIQPYSAISGVYNALAGPITFERESEKIVGRVTYGRAYEGPPNCVHGGIIAGVYDQLMAIASLASGKAGPTAFLHIDYKNMTPLFCELEFQAWIDKEEGRKITVIGQCLFQGEVVSSAQALFIAREGKMR